MQYTFTMPAAQAAAYLRSVQMAQLRKIVPQWIPNSLQVLFLLLVFASVYVVTRDINAAFQVTTIVSILWMLYQKTIRFFYRKYQDRHLASLPGYETWTVELSDGWVTWEHRGVRTSYALNDLSRVTEKDGFVFLVHKDPMRQSRIPFSAFPTPQDREDFIEAASAELPE